MLMRLLIVVVILCGPAAAPNAETPRVQRFTEEGPGSVNSFWIEAPGGLIVIDAQREARAARELAVTLRAAQKPVCLIIITHPHPDHYGGLALLAGEWPEAEIAASVHTSHVFSGDTEGYTALARSFLGDESGVPSAITLTLDNNETIESCGLDLVVDEIANTEFGAITMVSLPQYRKLFASDLVAHHMHPFLEDADIDGWRAALSDLEDSYADYELYPGHGAPGDAPALIRAQADYLDKVVAIARDVRTREPGAAMDEVTAKLALAIDAVFPCWPDVTGRPDIHALNAAAFLAFKRGATQKFEPEE